MKTIIVLGMHRSATSLVAKGLSNEIYMGDELMPANFGNPEGYFEHMPFVNLNNRILHAAGGSWKNPPTREAILEQEPIFRAEIQDTLIQHYREAERLGYKICGFKDPRTTLTIWLYAPWVQNPHYAFMWRQPGQIAHSLWQRSKLPVDEGKALAEHYRKEMLAFLSST